MAFWPFLVLQIVIFLGLVFVLRRLLSRHLMHAAAQLQGMNTEYAKRQEELKRRIQEAEHQYREQMTKARTEAEHLVAEAKREAESSKARMVEDARTESERIVKQGLDSRDALRKEIEQAMEGRAIERACELIQQILPGQLREAIQSQWLDELLRNGLSQLDGLQVEEVIKEARVVSAFPLNDSQRKLLQGRLEAKLGQAVTLQETVDATLVAGLAITLGSVVLDGSLASKLRHAARLAQPIQG